MAGLSQAAHTYVQAVLDDNPIAYWRLGNDASDSSAFARPAGSVDGTTGSVTFGQPSLVPSISGNGAVALSGDSAGQRRIVIPGFEKIGPNGHSAEYWVNVSAFPTSCCDNLVGDGEAGGDFWMMNYLIGPGQGDTGAIRPHYSVGNSPVALTTTVPNVLSLDTVYHVVTTWDPNVAVNNGQIWVNGALWLQGTVTGNVPAPGTTGDNTIFIGRDGRENRPSNFIIDEVALYDYALSPEQIQNHYNLGLVPEPASVSLLGLALMGALVRR
ncbi:MAG: LamG domain-containing protein, partial [Akkermansiaceae bacterium]|nr:LamG domain-containing protein [Akkermansiaceae bacterium]